MREAKTRKRKRCRMLRSMTESLLARLPGGVVPGSEVLQDLSQYANDREMGGVAGAGEL